jgi:hypothetical protein
VESTAVCSLKPERWGSLLVQEQKRPVTRDKVLTTKTTAAIIPDNISSVYVVCKKQK